MKHATKFATYVTLALMALMAMMAMTPVLASPAVSAPTPVPLPTLWRVNFIRYGNPTNWLGTLRTDASGHGAMAIHDPVLYTRGCSPSTGLGITSTIKQGAEVVIAPAGIGSEKVTVYLIYLRRMPLIKSGACLFERPTVNRATASFLVDVTQPGTLSMPLRGGFSINLTPAG